MPADLAVIDEPAAAHAALSPLRSRILAEMAEPASATEIATRLGLPRQKVNYHVGVLAEHGLIELVEERPRRGCIERLFRRSGKVVLAPDLLEPIESRQAGSAQAVVAAAADVIRALGDADTLQAPTAAMVTAVTFARPADMTAFLEQVAALAAGFDQGDGEGRRIQLSVLAHGVTGHQGGRQ